MPVKAETCGSAVVVKVGGSLYDLSDLGRRLGHLLTILEARKVLLVPGGGAAADVVRQLDRAHGLGEERAHWLALRALTLNAHFLAALLGDARAVVVEHPAAAAGAWDAGLLPVLDGHAFARADEAEADRLPHTWEVTSDSLALRATVVIGASRLVLAKSVDIQTLGDGDEATRCGLVDASFPSVVAHSRRRRGGSLVIEMVNLRDGRWGH